MLDNFLVEKKTSEMRDVGVVAQISEMRDVGDVGQR